MQDKEFDQLFRDKFEDAEVEPSLNLWEHIEEKLVVKPKRIFPVYWLAAAGIVLAVTIGLLFNRPEKIQLGATVTATKKIVHDTKENALAQQPIAQPVSKQGTGTAQSSVTALAATSARANATLATVDNRQQKVAHDGVKEQIVIADPVAVKKDLLAMQPSAVISHPDSKEPILKKETAKLLEVNLPVEEVVLASADVAKGDEENENKQAESGRIRNVGDLVNYVVDKVDKREEKFIQFKTDDDNSSLISLNIGMFRFNQKKHK